MNSVVLIGRLTSDPTLRFIPGNGMAVANFTIACDKGLSKEKKQEFQNQGKPVADFIRVVVWGKQAENCSQYLTKGKLVGVQGSIQTSTYKDSQGETRYQTEVLVNKVEFLEWGEKTESKKDDFSFESDSFEDFQSTEEDSCPF